MKRNLLIIFAFTLFLVTIACGDGSILQGAGSLSPEELLEKAQLPLKQTKGFAYTVKGTEFIPANPLDFVPHTNTKEIFYDVRANNEPFSMYYKGHWKNVHNSAIDSKPSVSETDVQGYLLQKYHYTSGSRGEIWNEDNRDVVQLGLMAPSPYDSINQMRSLLSMLKESQIDKKYVFKLKHEDGMYILEATNDFPPDFDPKLVHVIGQTLDQWFKKEFKLLLNKEGFVDPEYIDQHPDDPNLDNIDLWYFLHLKQSMWFDDQTFVLKKMSRETKVQGFPDALETKSEMNLKGKLKEKVVLPQQVIDRLE